MIEQSDSEPEPRDQPGEKAIASFWQKPAWVAALASLVAVVFTIPQGVSSYFQNNAEIKRQLIITRGSFIDKAMDASTVEDRLVVLRWLELSGVESEDKRWAQGEISKIDEFLQKESETEALKIELKRLEDTFGIESDEYSLTKEELAKKSEELSRARSQVGSLSGEVADLKARIKYVEDLNESLLSFRGRIDAACVNIKTPFADYSITDPNDERWLRQRITNEYHGKFCSGM